VRGAHYFVPKLLQNIFKQHSDQGLVIEQKNTRHKAYRAKKRGYSSSRLSKDAIGGFVARQSSGLVPSQMPLDRQFFIVASALAEFFLRS
jgi:hypothetical protein